MDSTSTFSTFRLRSDSWFGRGASRHPARSIPRNFWSPAGLSLSTRQIALARLDGQGDRFTLATARRRMPCRESPIFTQSTKRRSLPQIACIITTARVRQDATSRSTNVVMEMVVIAYAMIASDSTGTVSRFSSHREAALVGESHFPPRPI